MTNSPASASAPARRSPGTPRVARPLPPPLVTALRRAHEAELTATGDQRRPAFRLTRSLIGGARLAGFSATALAGCLGVRVESIRTRGGSDGWINGEVFTELAELPADTVEHWEADGVLLRRTSDATGRACFLASDLIRALAGGKRLPNQTRQPIRYGDQD